eukprot:3244982-Pleurochrysis_carterae.AAC.1
MPTVSAVCVSHGRPLMLERAIGLFWAQTYPKMELLILYDADDPATAKLAKVRRCGENEAPSDYGEGGGPRSNSLLALGCFLEPESCARGTDCLACAPPRSCVKSRQVPFKFFRGEPAAPIDAFATRLVGT